MTEPRSVRIGDFFKSGFDYEAFTKDIQSDNRFTEEQKYTTLYLFNPESTQKLAPGLYHDLIIGMFLSYAPLNITTRNLEADHPTVKVFQNVWRKAQQYYRKEIDEYIAKRNAAGLELENQYPLDFPEIIVHNKNPFATGFASRSGVKGKTGLICTLRLPESFLDLPLELQAAAFAHESQHFLDAVIKGATDSYAYGLEGSQKSKRSSRISEEQSDRLAVALGFGEELKNYIQATQDQCAEIYGRAKIVYDYASKHGFAFDERKFVKAIRDAAYNSLEIQGNRNKIKDVIADVRYEQKQVKAEMRNIVAGRETMWDNLKDRWSNPYPSSRKRIAKIEGWIEKARTDRQSRNNHQARC